MTNYTGTDLIRLIGIDHPDKITTDSDYEIGHITSKVGNKVRVNWTNRTEYVFTTVLAKLDKDTFWLKSDISDTNPQVKVEGSTMSDRQEPVNMSDDSDKTQNKVNSDILPYRDMEDESDKVLNPPKSPRSRRTPAKKA